MSNSNSLAELMALRARKRREYQFLSPNMIWFQRHETNPYIVAEVCLVSRKYRWQLYTGKSSKPIRAGFAGNLSKAMGTVFKMFRDF